MSVGLLDFTLSALIAVLGTLTGWFWRKLRVLSKAANAASSETQMRHAEAILGRLHDLAAGVAADVGEHNLQVEAINDRLTAQGGNDATAVVAAVSQLLAANSQMQRQLDSAQERLREQAKEIESQTAAARTDALTGLANRRVFDGELAALTERYSEEGKPFALTILDIDHFKEFNDTYGHQVGDVVLQHAAKVCLASVSDTDVVTRFGGEEFAVIHPGTSLEEATSRADALRQALDHSLIRTDDKELHVTVSLGVAEVAAADKPASLIVRADQALYAAKQGGRNRTFWHDGVGPQAYRPAQESPATERAEVLPKAGQAGNSTSTRNVRGPCGQVADEDSKNLLDRPAFLQKLAEFIAGMRCAEDVPTAFLVQIDRFDDHLDRYGAAIGGQLLNALATVLFAVARKQGAVAQFSKQSFSLLVPGYGPAEATMMAEQIRKLSRQCPLPIEAGAVEFTLSIGAAQVRGNDTADRMIERAEAALECAVRAGGDCVFFHTGSAPEPAEAILSEANCAV